MECWEQGNSWYFWISEAGTEVAQDWKMTTLVFLWELRCSEEILKPGKSPGEAGRFSGIRNRQCITEGWQGKVQTALENPSEISKNPQKTQPNPAPFPARKFLPSDSADGVDAELPGAAQPWEFEQLTAALIREPGIIGITDNQG